MVRLRSGRTLAFLGSPADGFVYRILDRRRPVRRRVVAAVAGQARSTKESDDPHPAAGPRGAFVMYEVAHHRPGVRRRRRRSCAVSTARSAGAARAACSTRSSANTTNADLAQDAKGRLYAVVLGYSDSGRRSCIAYARTWGKRWFTHAVSVHQTLKDAEQPGRVRLAVAPKGGGVVAWATTGTPSAVRVQWLKAGRGVTRPRAHSRRGCPPFPR